MATYKCPVCGYLHYEENAEKPWDELSDDWTCPVCGAVKAVFYKLDDDEDEKFTGKPEMDLQAESVQEDEYLAEWKKSSDNHAPYLNHIHTMAHTGKSITDPMKTTLPLISWNDILIKGAQLAKIPLEKNDVVNTKTIIGPRAKYPLVIDTPVYISHMSFGALSKEIKTALAKGSAIVKTLICSGEGGILPEEHAAAYKYIFEYVPNRYSVTDENLKSVDAVEIKIGQSVKPGMGGHLPASKVTEEIAAVRGRNVGEEIISPSAFKDIRNKKDLKAKIDWLRDKTGGKPIGVKIAAGDIETDLKEIIYAKPDFITIDGRGGGTGSAPRLIKDATSVPTLFALFRARRFLDDKGITGVSLIITGGLRVSSDFAKALALGADAIAVATGAMIAGGCQQYRICHTGNCPVGIATQDPELRKRLDIEKSANRIANYLKVSTEELKDFARLAAYDDVHKLNIKDLCTSNSEISAHTDIEHV